MPYDPGVIATWNRFPAIYSGPTGPLVGSFPAAIETPDIQWLGVGPLVSMRQWGFPVAYMDPSLRPEDTWKWAKSDEQPWGASARTNLLGDYHQYQSPASSPEAIRYVDLQRCVTVDTADLLTTGVAFELVHVALPGGSVGILERLPTIFDAVTALDLTTGDPLFSFGDLNGERPCLSSFVHPEDDAPLTWRFDVTITDQPYAGSNWTGAYLGPIPPQHIPGTRLIPSWTDMRYANDVLAGFDEKWVVPEQRILRYWVTLFAPPDHFQLTVGARLAGYWQIAGRRGAAIQSVDRRYGT